MRKIGWYAVSASVVVFVLGCVLLLAANLYVQSQAVQQRIRHALAAALRMQVSIKKTTITPWDGLRIDGLTAHLESPDLPAGESEPAVDYLLASSFRVHFDFGSLLSNKRLIINEVLLDQPKVAWAQDEQGRWQLPSDHPSPRKKNGAPGRSKSISVPDPKEPSAVPLASTAPEPVSVLSPPPVSSVAESVLPAAPPSGRTNVPIHSIGKVRLRHGNLAFLNNKRHQVGHFEELDLDGQLSDLQHATGTMGFAKASLPRVGLTLTKFHSDFIYSHEEGLALNNGHAQLAGGEVTASYHLRTGEPDSPFTIQCRLENVGLGQLIREAGSKAKLLEGRLQGDLQVAGLSDNLESRTASGQIQLVNARVRDFPIFRVLGEMLRIEDLSHLEFKQAQLNYRLDGTVLQVDPLVLVSNNLRITAQGKYLTANDRLDLHARLTLDQAVSRQLPPSVMQQFQPDADTPGSRYIDFDITGPAAKPNTNLYKRLLAPQVNDLLQSLLSPKSRTPKDKFLKRIAPPLPDEPPADSPEP